MGGQSYCVNDQTATTIVGENIKINIAFVRKNTVTQLYLVHTVHYFLDILEQKQQKLLVSKAKHKSNEFSKKNLLKLIICDVKLDRTII